MIDPKVLGRVDGGSVAVCPASIAHVVRGAHDPRRAPGMDVVNGDPVDDDVVHVVQHQTRASHNLHVHPAPIDGLEADVTPSSGRTSSSRPQGGLLSCA